MRMVQQVFSRRGLVELLGWSSFVVWDLLVSGGRLFLVWQRGGFGRLRRSSVPSSVRRRRRFLWPLSPYRIVRMCGGPRHCAQLLMAGRMFLGRSSWLRSEGGSFHLMSETRWSRSFWLLLRVPCPSWSMSPGSLSWRLMLLISAVTRRGVHPSLSVVSRDIFAAESCPRTIRLSLLQLLPLASRRRNRRCF